jgi:hypothetical protein
MERFYETHRPTKQESRLKESFLFRLKSNKQKTTYKLKQKFLPSAPPEKNPCAKVTYRPGYVCAHMPI